MSICVMGEGEGEGESVGEGEGGGGGEGEGEGDACNRDARWTHCTRACMHAAPAIVMPHGHVRLPSKEPRPSSIPPDWLMRWT